jgi:hypothetical protein
MIKMVYKEGLDFLLKNTHLIDKTVKDTLYSTPFNELNKDIVIFIDNIVRSGIEKVKNSDREFVQLLKEIDESQPGYTSNYNFYDAIEIMNEYFPNFKNDFMSDVSYFVQRLMFNNFAFNNKPKDVYRAITLNKSVVYKYAQKLKNKDYSNIKIEVDGVGIYWGLNIENAKAYWGDKSDVNTILHAVIHEKDVDWKETIEIVMTNLWRTEREIRLKQNTKIWLEEIIISAYDLGFSRTSPDLVFPVKSYVSTGNTDRVKIPDKITDIKKHI